MKPVDGRSVNPEFNRAFMIGYEQARKESNNLAFVVGVVFGALMFWLVAHLFNWSM